MLLRTILIMTFILTGSCSALAVEEQEILNVSLMELIIKPEDYYGRVVSVSGYLKFGSDLRLYLTKDHAEINDFDSSIEINDTSQEGALSQSSCTKNYVRVEGKFSKLYEGYIYGMTDIRIIYLFEKNDYCWDENQGM